MKKRLAAFLIISLAVFSMTGCKAKIKTELPMKNIHSMMVNGYGDLYLLTDDGIRYYALSGDKEVDYIYGKDEISEAEFTWIDNGEKVTYGGFKIERLIAAGDDGVTMAGRYMTNTAGRDNDLFVLQDAADLNVGAGFFDEIQRDEEASGPVLNGIGIVETGMYFKLNRPYSEDKKLDNGTRFLYYGSIEPFDVPDSVTGAAEKDDSIYFLVENKKEAKIVCGGQTVLEYPREELADAFVSKNAFYAVYKNGKVTKWTIGGEETKYKDLGVSIGKINDTLIWDGQLYWFDKEGVKTVK